MESMNFADIKEHLRRKDLLEDILHAIRTDIVASERIVIGNLLPDSLREFNQQAKKTEGDRSWGKTGGYIIDYEIIGDSIKINMEYTDQAGTNYSHFNVPAEIIDAFALMQSTPAIVENQGLIYGREQSYSKLICEWVQNRYLTILRELAKDQQTQFDAQDQKEYETYLDLKKKFERS